MKDAFNYILFKIKENATVIFGFLVIALVVYVYYNSDQYKADYGKREFFKDYYEQKHGE